MPVEVTAIGNVETANMVAVKSRVDGQIVEVFFRDGQDVAKGAPLFQIDPRPFQAQLRQAEANLLRSKAQLQHARAQDERYRDLLEKNFVSKDYYSQIRTNLDTNEAAVRAEEAAVENAKLQLGYCLIRAPIEGRVGKVLVALGNMVKANDAAPLVTINQISPIYLTFAVPERYLVEVSRLMKKGPLRTRVSIPNSETPAVTAELVFIDNAVDTTTGTIKLRAVYRNQDKLLWPGQFVNVVLHLYDQPGALVVPSKAVQNGPKGQYVFVVNDESKAELRDIVLDRTIGEEAIVSEGLQPADRVVTDGQMRLAPGVKVNVRGDAAPS
jgi:multidrug efflux system membrane fusion protein